MTPKGLETEIWEVIRQQYRHAVGNFEIEIMTLEQGKWIAHDIVRKMLVHEDTYKHPEKPDYITYEDVQFTFTHSEPATWWDHFKIDHPWVQRIKWVSEPIYLNITGSETRNMPTTHNHFVQKIRVLPNLKVPEQSRVEMYKWPQE